MRAGGVGAGARVARGLVALSVLLGLLVVGDPIPSGAHTPHEDIFDVSVSPAFDVDRTVLAISRSLIVRSTDGGRTWQRIVNGLDNRSIPYQVAFTGSSSRAYAVTGDGVFRSDDGGLVWRRVLSSSAKDLRILATSTGSPDVAVVAGATTGLRMTSDGGATWRTLGSFGAAVSSVAFKKRSTQVVFVGTADGQLHVTGNTGATWQHYAIPGAGSVTAIALSPAFQTDSTALIGTSSSGLHRWNHSTRTSNPVTGITDTRITSVAYSANVGFDGTAFAATWNGGLFTSSDRGSTWTASNDGLTWDSQTTLPGFLDRPNFGRVVSGLANAVTREPVVFVAAFTGFYSSEDLGASWQHTQTLPRSIVVGMAISPQYATDGKVAISTYVNGAFASTDRGATFAPRNLGLAQPGFWDDGPDAYTRLFGMSYAPAAGGGSWMFTSRLFFGGSLGGLLRSNDDGASWSLTTIAGFSTAPTSGSRLPFVLPSPSFATDRTVLFVDGVTGVVNRSTDEGASFQSVGTVPRQVRCLQASPSFAVDRRIFACTSNGVYVSTDLGATWSVGAKVAANALAVVQRTGTSAETWLAATTNGLYRSANLGASWTRVSLPSPIPANAQIAAVAASPPSSAPGTVLVSLYGKGLLRSVDGGATFGPPSTALLSANEQLDNFERPTSSPIVFSPAFAADATVFGYSHDRLFRSTDGGVTWTRLTVPVATHSGPFPVAPSAPIIAAVTGGPGSITIEANAGADGGAPITRFDAVCTPTAGGSPSSGSSTGSTVVVTGVTNGASYTCSVTATNALGTSPPSAPSATVVPLGPPGAPTGVAATATVGGASVSWSAPLADGGRPVTGYVVAPYVGYYPLPPVTFSSTATTQLVEGLPTGATLRFRVAAINVIGTGLWSTVSNPVVPL